MQANLAAEQLQGVHETAHAIAIAMDGKKQGVKKATKALARAGYPEIKEPDPDSSEVSGGQAS